MLFAAPANQEAAILVARSWLRASPRPLNSNLGSQIAGIKTKTDANGNMLYHVISLSPDGFLVVSTDTDLEPIIAFSEAGHFENAPDSPLVVLLDLDLATRIGGLRHLDRPSTSQERMATAKWVKLTGKGTGVSLQGTGLETLDDIRVPPLIQSRWNQGSIWASEELACYNYYTPPGEAGDPTNYWAGCNNTAWAQIMRYFQYPSQAVGTESFTIHVDGVEATRSLLGGDSRGGPYRWDLMPLIPGPSITKHERQAIGALIADIGTTCGTYYTAGGSSAGMSEYTLKRVFQFSQAISSSLGGEGVLASLDAALPAMLSISGDGGHMTVCDGYGYNAGTLYHHINMGWGGSKDAWYNLPNVDTDYYNFTIVGNFYYNIYPSGTGEVISGRVLTASGKAIPATRVQAVGGSFDRSVETDGRGIFAFSHVPSNSRFTISATHEGFSFPVREVTTGESISWGDTGNRWGINLIGEQDLSLRMITGSVTNIDGTGVPGVCLEFSGVAGTVTTEANGAFLKTVPAGWTGTATPAKTQFVFDPPVRAFSAITASLGGQDFKATQVLLVNANATGLIDGSSWANAFTNMQTALSQAPFGSEIWVAQGIYQSGTERTNSFMSQRGVCLLGGFRGDERFSSQRDWIAHETILSGNLRGTVDLAGNAYHVVVGAEMARLDGFTITGGNANGLTWDTTSGGGVFFNPWAEGEFVVANCRIVGNSAQASGGGVAGATVLNSVICHNTADAGGGAADSQLRNCLLNDNSAKNYGGGAYDSELLNCTVVANGAAWASGAYGGTATNSIVFFNQNQNGGNLAQAHAAFSCFPEATHDQGNFTDEPRFVDLANGDYRLAPDSPCINAGINDLVWPDELDLAGQSRLRNGIVDLGAYETEVTTSRLTILPRFISAITMIGRSAPTLAIQVWNAGLGSMAYTVTTDATWLTVISLSGSSSGERNIINVNVDVSLLAQGVHRGVITITASQSVVPRLSVPITLVVQPDYNVALNTGGWNWQTTGDNIWLTQSVVTCDGVLAIRSAPLTDNQQANLETTLTGPGMLKYWWRVSSEPSCDILSFLLDANEQDQISGEVGWEQRTCAIPAGSHTISWIYAKDSSVASGQDAAWLDRVSYDGPACLFGATLDAGRFSLSLQTDDSKSYVLEYKDALSDPQWVSLPSIPGDGQVKALTDSASTVPRRFYRVRQQ